MRLAGPILALVVGGLCAAGAQAAITWSTSGSLSVGVLAPPVEFQAGNGASKDRFISDFTLSANATSFGLTVKGRVGGDITVKDVARIVETGGAPRSVTLRGLQVGDTEDVLVYRWIVKDGGSTVATMDMLASSPSASFTLPASDIHKLDLRLKLAKGIDPEDAVFATSVWVVVG